MNHNLLKDFIILPPNFYAILESTLTLKWFLMSKEENSTKALEIFEEAWKTKSAILLTDDYLYMMLQLKDGKWKEASFIFEDASLEVRELEAEKALMLLIEEITTGLPGYESYTIVLDNESKENVKERVESAGKS